MGLREEVVEMKNEVKAVKSVKEQSLAMELIQDHKKANKRMFILNIILIVILCLLVGYIVYLLNDTTVITDEYTQEITDVENIESSSINNGGK